MVIEVRLYASLRQYRPSTAYNMSDNSFVTVDVPDGISIGELLDELEMDADEVKRMLVNGLNSDFERVLTDGDQVALYPGG